MEDDEEPPSWISGLKALAELRKELEKEQRALLRRRSGLEKELKTLDTELASTRRQLELVQATEKLLAAQWEGRPAIEEWGPNPSTQVRAPPSRRHISDPVGQTSGLCRCCGS
jgi:hypothetical protein